MQALPRASDFFSHPDSPDRLHDSLLFSHATADSLLLCENSMDIDMEKEEERATPDEKEKGCGDNIESGPELVSGMTQATQNTAFDTLLEVAQSLAAEDAASVARVTTVHRVVFENGHCLLSFQENTADYLSTLPPDVQLIAGKCLSVYDTRIAVLQDGQPARLSVCMENLCGSIAINFENVATAGDLLRHGAPRVGRFVQHRQFIGTHHLFHTIHGRLAYRVNQKNWSFKGCRSVPDLVKFMRNLTNDYESPILATVNMLSVTVRTDMLLVIDPAHSLMQRVIERLYHAVVVIQQRVDDTNNLFFMDVVSWPRLLHEVEHESTRGSLLDGGTGQQVSQKDIQLVHKYLTHCGHVKSSQPTASIGYTRKGVFFVRITFPRGCVCNVPESAADPSGGSHGGPSGELAVDPSGSSLPCENSLIFTEEKNETRSPTGVATTRPERFPSVESGDYHVGMVGVEPFVNVVVCFVQIILQKIQAVRSIN